MKLVLTRRIVSYALKVTVTKHNTARKCIDGHSCSALNFFIFSIIHYACHNMSCETIACFLLFCELRELRREINSPGKTLRCTCHFIIYALPTGARVLTVRIIECVQRTKKNVYYINSTFQLDEIVIIRARKTGK